jgi:hypothetical protein
MPLRRSISVMPSAVRRSSSTERISVAILVALASLLRLFVVVEFAFDALVGAVEGIEGRPQEIIEVGFEAGFAQARDEGIEDVRNGGSNHTGLGQWSRVGFVMEGTIAVKLEFGENVIGRGCGTRRLVDCLVVLDRHGGFPSSDLSRSSRPSWRRKAAGGPDLHRGAQRRRPERAAEDGRRGILSRDVKRRLSGAMENSGPRHYIAGPPAAESPFQEGRERAPLRQ